MSGNLNLLLNTAVTNRVNADSIAADVALTVDTGGSNPAPVAGRIAGSSIAFNGVSFTVPASGPATLRVSNLRVNASQLGLDAQAAVQALITTSFSNTALSNNPVTVARTARGLLTSQATTGINCTGSPLPSSIGFQKLLAAGTSFASTRGTEGFAGAFQVKDATSDAGTRIIVRYSGIPAGVRLFVPDVIAGSDAVAPTAGGDLGGTPSGGQYAPSASGSLLLARVNSTDANGAGGLPVYRPGAPGSGTVTLDAVSEVASSGGNGFVVYEVMDVNPLVQANAQFPTFVGVPNTTQSGAIGWTVSLAPVSDQAAASVTAPVPRFVAAVPPSDCSAVGDCSANYFPKLEVLTAPQPLRLSAVAGAAAADPGYITIDNSGGGAMNWTATVTYKTGAAWLTLGATSGINRRVIRVNPAPQKLVAGTYEAVVTIDAGTPTGLANVPVVLSVAATPSTPPVTPVTPPPITPPVSQPAVTVSGIANSADFVFGAIAPGSQAVVIGSNLSGAAVAVTFDGIAAKLLSTGASQIKLIVPAELGTRTSTLMVVTVDGVSSAPSLVALAPFAPAVFRPGILNPDGSINGQASPAAPGAEIVVLTTGLTGIAGSAVTVKIHDRDGLVPSFVGPVDGADGVQQVHVTVPNGLPAMTADIFVCAAGPDSQRTCSFPAPIAIGQ